MSDIAIRVEGLSKQFRIGSAERYRTLRDTLTDVISAPFRVMRNGRSAKTPAEMIWALKDVSFDVKRGEVIGIIGRNGAGKSTLLKILSRITEPTQGHADIHGRVGSLLEVGTGFHPELSGRENIFLNGAILGMKRAEIVRKFDEIVAFAEVEKFIDTPVKHYSSGMYMRLAFAVAAHMEPEILIVDEVLAVGDAAFQKKCLGKMGDVAKHGRTVLFVSHNTVALQSLCTVAVQLDAGRVVAEGPPKDVVAGYLSNNLAMCAERTWSDPGSAPGNEVVRLQSVRVMPQFRSNTDIITVDTAIDVEISYWNFVEGAELNVSMFLDKADDVCVFNAISGARFYAPTGIIRQTCHIPAGLLNDSKYRIRLMVVEGTSVPLVIVSDVVSFEVQDVERDWKWYGKWEGVVRPRLTWTTEVLPAAAPDGLLPLEARVDSGLISEARS